MAFTTQLAGQPNFNASPFAVDFVVLGNEDPTVPEVYYPSNGDGTFGNLTAIPGLGYVDGLDVADLDGDGDNDFLVCDGGTGRVLLYINEGSGLFVPEVVANGITATFFCTYLRILDFNLDGQLDFVVGDNRNILGTKVYTQGPSLLFSASAVLDTTWTNTGNNLFGLAAGDVDCDGAGDIVMLGYFGSGAGQVRLYLNDGSGQFDPPVLLFNLNTDFGLQGNTGLALFDEDGDGDLDIITGGATGSGDDSGKHFVYTNDGNATFMKPAGPAFDVDRQTGIDAYDVDGDGDHDLVLALGERFMVAENLGGSLAQPFVVGFPGSSFLGIGAPPLIGDLDGDGVSNCLDECHDSTLSETVILDDCNSGVENVRLANGCTLQDLLDRCGSDILNHGQFVSCVASVLGDLENGSILNHSERGAIQGCAARAAIP